MPPSCAGDGGADGRDDTLIEWADENEVVDDGDEVSEDAGEEAVQEEAVREEAG